MVSLIYLSQNKAKIRKSTDYATLRCVLILIICGDACSLIHGNGEAVRNFVHAADIANAFDLILHEGVPGETYNIGTESQISMIQFAKDLVRKVCAPGPTRLLIVSLGTTRAAIIPL